MGGIKKRKPLHPCVGCGIMVSALKKRCAACSAEELDRKRQINLRKRREAAKALRESANG